MEEDLMIVLLHKIEEVEKEISNSSSSKRKTDLLKYKSKLKKIEKRCNRLNNFFDDLEEKIESVLISDGTDEKYKEGIYDVIDVLHGECFIHINSLVGKKLDL